MYRKHGVACNCSKRESAQIIKRLKTNQLLLMVITVKLNRILLVLSILSRATASSNMFPNLHVLVRGHSLTITVLKTIQLRTKTTARFLNRILCKYRLLIKMIQETLTKAKWYLEALTPSTGSKQAKMSYNSMCLSGGQNQPDN